MNLVEQAIKRGTPLVVAELGARYAEIAVMKRMVLSARDCGAEFVKFQTYRAETIATPGSFFTMEDGSRVPQFDFFKAHELSAQDHRELIACCEDAGIGWFSTPSHATDVELLETFDPPCYKTGSDDLTNLPLLRHIARKQRPILISTGMCTLDEVERAVSAVTLEGNNLIVLLHCVVSYPSKSEDANLRAIETLRTAFGFPVGLSDHTRDEFTSVLATQMGVAVLEKHFTPDHAMKLPDHEASLDPVEFRRLVDCVRLVPRAMGDGVKRILPTEEKWRSAARKSIFSARLIRKGETIQETDLAVRRPADGIHPHRMDELIGRVAREDIPADTLIRWDMA